VLGFGVGALAVLLGLAARDLGPMLRRVPREGSIPWAVVAERVTWGRACRAGGLVVAMGGAMLCVLTGAALLARSSDDTGMLVVLGGVVVLLLSIAAWAIRYRMSPSEQPDRPVRGQRPAKKIRPNRSERADRSARSEASGSRGRDGAGGPEAEDAQVGAAGERPGRVSVPAGHRVADAPPMGALTVDAMGGFRRAPVTTPTSEESAPVDAPTPNRDSRRRPMRRAGNDPSRGARPSGGQNRNR